MTIYWERCSICKRNIPVKQCTLHPELLVCASCCILCPNRGVCPRPAWFPAIGSSEAEKAKTIVGKTDAKKKVLEDLLKRLG